MDSTAAGEWCRALDSVECAMLAYSALLDSGASRSPRRWSSGGWPCWSTASPRCRCAACRCGKAVRRANHSPAFCEAGCPDRFWLYAAAVSSCAARVSSAGALGRCGSRTCCGCWQCCSCCCLIRAQPYMCNALARLHTPSGVTARSGLVGERQAEADPWHRGASQPAEQLRSCCRPEAHAGRHRLPERQDAGQAAAVRPSRPAHARQRARPRHALPVHRAALGLAAPRGAGARRVEHGRPQAGLVLGGAAHGTCAGCQRRLHRGPPPCMHGQVTATTHVSRISTKF